jgi:hypothetical protein
MVTPTGMLAKGGNAYFNANPDVAAAFAKDSYGMNADQFAATHSQKFGVAEGRVAASPAVMPAAPLAQPTSTPQATVSPRTAGPTQESAASKYFAQNRDVTSAFGAENYGLSGDEFALTHFNKFGRAEGRAWPEMKKLPVLQAPQAPPQFAPEFNRSVNAKSETIEGRIQNLLGADAQGNYTNPVVRQASERAMQTFAGRGLLNSSMAQQAAIEAATSKAIEIAGPDAQTYFSQGRANQDAQNVFSRDEVNFGYDMQKLDKELAMRNSQFDRELAYKFEAMKFDTDSRTLATEVAQKNALEINNIKSVNDQYDLYLRRISEIEMNKELLGPAKLKAKNDAGKDFDVFARASKIVWETMGGRYEEAAPTGTPTAPTAAPGGMLNSSDNFA